MVRLTRSIDFSASLRYRHGDLSPAENERLFGAGARTHGHNYRLEVTLRGPVDPATGMVFDLGDLKEILEREVMARFDHHDLNADTPYFEKRVATPENLVAVLAEILARALPGLLDRLRLYQDDELWVDWIAGDGEAP